MPARSVSLLRENHWQFYESPHSNGLVVKEQKWLKTKRRNSWGWMSDDKCISSRWHFHHHLIDHLWDILNGVYVCATCRFRQIKTAPTPKHTYTHTYRTRNTYKEKQTQNMILPWMQMFKGKGWSSLMTSWAADDSQSALWAWWICLINNSNLSSRRNVQSLKQGANGSVNLALTPCTSLASLSLFLLVCLLVFSGCSLAAQTVLSKSPFRQRKRQSCGERESEIDNTGHSPMTTLKGIWGE